MGKNKRHINLESIGKKNIFSVPELYFDQLNTEIIHKIEARSILFKKSSTESMYKVPEGYFEKLSEAIAKKTIPDESILSKKLKGQIYSTPEGYFEDSYTRIQNRISSSKKRSLLPEWSAQPVFRFAMAAVSAGIIAFTGWWIFLQKDTTTETISMVVPVKTDATKLIAQLDKNEIRSYLAAEAHEELVMEAAVVSNKTIHREIEKSIPVDKVEKELIKEELESLDIEDLDL